MTFSVESVICRLADSCTLSPAVSHVSWKNDLLSNDPKLPTFKAQIQMLVTSLPKTVTAFEPGRSFFQQRVNGHRSGPTNGQNRRMAKFEVNGQNFKFSKTANGHGHSPNRQNLNRRMASQNLIFSSPQRLLRTDPDPIWTRPNNPNLKVTLSFH